MKNNIISAMKESLAGPFHYFVLRLSGFARKSSTRKIISKLFILLRIPLFDNLVGNVWWYFFVTEELHRAGCATLRH